MQTASTASPRLRSWLVLGATSAIVAGVVIASLGHDPTDGMAEHDIVTPVFEPPGLERTSEPARVIAPAEALGIVVVASRTQIKRGQPWPLAFYAVNRTAGPLHVLRSLDASDAGWRYPKIDLEIRDAKGELVLGPTIGRCGLVNPLTDEDFVELASGDRVDLLGEGTFGHYKLRDTSYLRPGRYTVTLRYDLRFDELERGKQMTIDERVSQRIGSLPKGLYFSPPITIDLK